jgi:hypothetical protein
MPQATPRTPQAPPAPAPASSPVGTGTPLNVLRQQAIDLSQQLAGLKAERVVIDRQLRTSNLDGGALVRVNLRRDNLVEQIVQVEGDLANVRAQIASRQGLPIDRVSGEPVIIQNPPNFRTRTGVDPEMIIGMSFALLMVIAIPMSIAFARRLWRGKPQPVGPKVDEIAPRLDRLEQAVDAIAIEIERISEGQRFVTKVMAERPMHAARAEGPDVSPEEGRPSRALGAGPAEPIRVPERQAVRSVITPH